MNSELEYILQYKHFLILNPPYLNKVMVIRVAKPIMWYKVVPKAISVVQNSFENCVHCGFFDFRLRQDHLRQD